MKRHVPDHAAALRAVLEDLPALDRVEATFRLGGPVGAQSVVNLYTSGDHTVARELLAAALPRCAAALAEAKPKGNLYLYAFDGEGLRHTLEEVSPDLSVAISLGRLADFRSH